MMRRTLPVMVSVVSFCWLVTHDACMHPLGTTRASIATRASGAGLLLPRVLAGTLDALDVPDEGEVTE